MFVIDCFQLVISANICTIKDFYKSVLRPSTSSGAVGSGTAHVKCYMNCRAELRLNGVLPGSVDKSMY